MTTTDRQTIGGEKLPPEPTIQVEHVRPCPFCGGAPAWRLNGTNGGWGLFCNRIYKGCVCGPCTLDFPDPRKTIRVWNTRKETNR